MSITKHTRQPGFDYSRERTVFTLWSPNAEKVVIRLYRLGSRGRAFVKKYFDHFEDGYWTVTLTGDLEGLFYTYQIKYQGCYFPETPDPYARSCGANGFRSQVVDMRRTDPEGFAEDHGPHLDSPVDAIVTEISVADVTADPICDFKYPGKFLGLTETGVKTKWGYVAGLDYYKMLGVTHVQIMPIFDAASLDEENPKSGYNWGYDPQNYNVPEGSYATDPYDGRVRIRECKAMIRAFHKAGIGVIMDVVYNHVYDVYGCCLQRTNPDYCFRFYEGQLSNGSGCGNEVASERPMMRRYIIDSLIYWLTEYHVDGFRFDLMGLIDIDTINEAQRELRKIRPDVLLYGEGWTGGMTTLPEEKRSIKANAGKFKGIAVFSDDIRDHIKGHVFDAASKGFVNGKDEMVNNIKYCVAAACPHPQVDLNNYYYSNHENWADTPESVVNYVSCHDNYTLWDKLTLSCPGLTEQKRLEMNRLAASMIFTAQGMPFFLTGEEFCRTKPTGDGYLSGNSYNLPLEVNRLHYAQTGKYQNLFRFYMGLIAFRKSHSALRLRTGEAVRNQIHFLEDLPEHVVAFTVCDEKEKLLVIYNGRDDDVEIPIPDKEQYYIQVRGAEAGLPVLEAVRETVLAPALSAVAGYRKE